MKSYLIAAAVLATGISTSAFAAPIVSESFDYPLSANGDTMSGLNGGTGFSAGWVAPGTAGTTASFLSAGYNMPGLQSETGGALLVGSNTSAIYRAIDPSVLPVSDVTTRWFSVILDPTDSTVTNLTQRIQFETTSNSTNNGYGMNVDFNTSAGNGQTVVYLRIGSGAGSGTPAVTVPGREPLLIIGKYDGSTLPNASLSLWVNPTDLTSEAQLAATATGAISAQALVPAVLGDFVAIRGGAIASVDEMRIGLSLADVAAIPEPASLGLLGLGGLALGRRRRNA